MEVLSFMLAGVLIAVTGFGALMLFALGSMAFAALPAAIGWVAGEITKRMVKT